MNLDEAIKVKGILVNPLKDLKDSDIPKSLGIKLSDLDKIRERYSDNDDSAYITPGTSISYSSYGFDIATKHTRTLIFQQPKNISKRFDLEERTLAVKGSGIEAWIKNEYAHPSFIDLKENTYQYPILRNLRPALSTHRVWGGETEEMAKLQYLNSLIIILLAERYGITPAVYFPKKIIKFRELPRAKNGEMETISLEEYCYQTFQKESSHLSFAVPSIEQAEKFVEFFYEGKNVGLRVPPPTFKDFHEKRLYSAGWLHGIYYEKEVREMVKKFSVSLAENIKIVHEANGTFTEVIGDRYLSSLSAGNVSVGGTICDLDTVSFGGRNNEGLQVKQEFDILRSVQTIVSFADLFEEELKKPREGLEYSLGMGYNSCGFPTYGFSKEGLRVLEEIVPIPKEVRRGSEKYFP